jgi:hypothetical protein
VIDHHGGARGRRRTLMWLGGLAALAVVAAVVAAGCGGGSGNGVARADTGSSSGSDASSSSDAGTSTSQADVEEAQLKFAKCMRDQGLDFPDPKPDANGNLRFQTPRGSGDRNKFQAAAQNCSQYLKGIRPQLTPEQQSEFQDAALKYAKCMRAEGIDVPDPTGSGPGGGGGAFLKLDRNDPKVQAANQKCEKYIQGVIGRRGGGS